MKEAKAEGDEAIAAVEGEDDKNKLLTADVIGKFGYEWTVTEKSVPGK